MAPATLRDILKDLDTTRRKSHAYLVTFLEQSLSRSLSSLVAKDKARLLAKGLHKRFTGKVWSKESFINFLNSPKEDAYLGQVVLEDTLLWSKVKTAPTSCLTSRISPLYSLCWSKLKAL